MRRSELGFHSSYELKVEESNMDKHISKLMITRKRPLRIASRGLALVQAEFRGGDHFWAGNLAPKKN